MFRFLRRQPAQASPAEPEPSLHDVLLSERPSDVLWRWARSGYLREVLPDLAALGGVTQLPAHRDDALVHTLKVIDAIEPTPVRRWAALLHDIGKGPTFIETPEGRSRFFEHDRFGAEMTPEIIQAAGADPALVEPVRRLVSLHMRPISYNDEWSDTAVRRLREEAEEGRGEAGWHDLLALAHADLRGYLPEPIDRGLWVLDRLQAHAQRLHDEAQQEAHALSTAPRSPLDGHHLLSLTDRAPGPWIAELKAYLLNEVESGRLDAEDAFTAERLAREWLGIRD
jgi:putative nucleotidyltransferase with HDIG domain